MKSSNNTCKKIIRSILNSIKELTITPRPVLVINRYKNSPITLNVLPLNLETSSFCTALKRTTDVASFTTPSPKTRLYSKGVSSWWRTYKQIPDAMFNNKSTQKVSNESKPFTNLTNLQCANRVRWRENCSYSWINLRWTNNYHPNPI